LLNTHFKTNKKPFLQFSHTRTQLYHRASSGQHSEPM